MSEIVAITETQTAYHSSFDKKKWVEIMQYIVSLKVCTILWCAKVMCSPNRSVGRESLENLVSV